MITEDRYKGLEACLELCYVVAHQPWLVPSLANLIISQMGVSVCLTVWVLVCVCTCIRTPSCTCVHVIVDVPVVRNCLKKNCFAVNVQLWSSVTFTSSFLPLGFDVFECVLLFSSRLPVHVAILTLLKNRVDLCFFLAYQPEGWGGLCFSLVNGAEVRMWPQSQPLLQFLQTLLFSPPNQIVQCGFCSSW